MIDALLAGVIVTSASTAPSDASEGSLHRVTGNAQGEWEGQEDALALMAGGAWHFVQPRNGMRIFDQETKFTLVFDGAWQTAQVSAAPQGGSVIDIEARAALSELIDALKKIGVISDLT